MKRVMFVSGHLDTTYEEFCTHYIPKIRQAAEQGWAFVVGDAPGTDAMAQKWLADENDLLYAMEKPLLDVTVFHMLKAPRYYASCEFQPVGGFNSDDERDGAMTLASDEDIAWVRPGKESSGTARNLARRKQGRF
jgi:hypothetical protein